MELLGKIDRKCHGGTSMSVEDICSLEEKHALQMIVRKGIIHSG